MPDDLTFLMGQYAARIPADLRYSQNHLWVAPQGGRRRVGFTAYAVRLLQDVYFLEWTVGAGQSVAFREQIGMIESSKAEAELYAPFAGVIAEFNPAVLKDPSAINVDGYGGGWLFEMQGEFAEAMTAEEYVAFLAAGWEATQRTIKGQYNE